MILRGPQLGPERNPLETEAARAREEHATQGEPRLSAIDMRRVTAEGPEGKPYYEIAPQAPREPKGLIARPSAAETIGPPTGRLAKIIGANPPEETQLKQIEAPKPSQPPIEQRFSPDILDDARREIQSAADLAGSFDRPGRYFSTYAQNEQPTVRAGQEKTFGGIWYGVGSTRHMVADQFPWFANIKEGAGKLGVLAEKGQGAAYNRVLERVATHIQNERESARPVIEATVDCAASTSRFNLEIPKNANAR